MKSHHYGEIASKLKIDLDDILNIVNTMIGYKMSNLVSTFIRVKEQFLEEDEELSEAIVNWPIYLQNGIHNKVQLILFQLGFNEKIGMLMLSEEITKYYSDNSFSTTSISLFLKKNKKKILNNIQKNVPVISFRELKKNLSYVTRDLW